MQKDARHAKAQYMATVLLKSRVPLVYVQLVALVCLAGFLDAAPLYDAIEYDAGRRAITRAMHTSFLRVAAYDIIDSQYGERDMLSPHGMVFAIMLACCTIPGGFAWFAPVCSSWIWMCTSVTGRCAGFPMGRSWVPQVSDGNVMYARTLLLARHFDAFGCVAMLEQPALSVMQYADRFQQWIADQLVFMSPELCLGLFGATSKKPIRVFSNFPFVHELLQHAPLTTLLSSSECLSTVSWHVDADGQTKKRTTGNAVAMKESPGYPDSFGCAVATVYMSHRQSLMQGARQKTHVHTAELVDVSELLQAKPCDMWQDADLGPAFDYLMGILPHVKIWCRE